ncbi:MAG: hypothetical protein KC414_09295, partial [Romboutsia sp.]|nr:hypothetical protein [Romboutsia sp.]
MKPSRLFYDYTIYMKHIFLFLSLVVFLLSKGQTAYFTDKNWNYFNIFSEDRIVKAEFIPIVEAKYGKDYVAYIRNNNRFIISTNGEQKDMNIVNPKFYAKDNILAYFVDEQLWILENGKVQFLCPWVETNFALGDEILCFTNMYGEFKVYYQDSTYIIGQWAVNQIKAGDNTIVYLDNNNIFKIFYEGEVTFLESNPPF